MLILSMGGMVYSHGQGIGTKGATYDELLGRALRMDDTELSALSPRMNHLWMASLVDSLQPAALSEMATTNFRLDRRKEGLRQLQTAFRTSGYDYHLGLMLLQVAGRYQEWTLAEQVTDRLLTQKPNDAYLLQLLSAVYEESGQMDRAISTMRKLVEMKENEPQYVFGLANQLLKSGRHKEAEELLLKYRANRPDEPMSSAMLISLWLSEERYEEANALLERVKTRFPSNPDVISMTISTYAQQGMNRELSDEILKAARQEGATPEGMEELIRIASQDSNDLTRLLKDLIPLRRELITIFDRTPQLSLSYANHLFLLRDTIAAEQVLDEMVERRVEVPSPYAYFIQKYAMIEDEPNIRKYTTAGLGVMPTEGLFLLYHALLASNGGDMKMYEKRVNHAIEVVSEEDLLYPRIALMKAEIDNENGKWEEAKAYYQKAVGGGDPMALNNYAYALLEKGKTREEMKLAEQMAQQAVKAAPDDPNHLDTYAWALYKNKAYAVAKIYIESAIDKAKSAGDRSMKVLYEHYAEILTAMGRYDEALAAWRDALAHGSDAETVRRALDTLDKLKNNPDNKKPSDDD